MTAVARYQIVPERSRVWIDARSSVHPIHSTTDGLEGFIDVETQADDGLDLSVEPGRQAVPAGRPPVVGQPAGGPRVAQAHRRPALPDHRRRAHRIERVGDDGRYNVSGDLAFRGVVRRCEDEMTSASSTIARSGSRADRRSTSATSAWSRPASSCCGLSPRSWCGSRSSRKGGSAVTANVCARHAGQNRRSRRRPPRLGAYPAIVVLLATDDPDSPWTSERSRSRH